MEEKIEEIQKQIETSREHLYSLIDYYEFTDEEMITESQRLDKLLNKYNEMIRSI